MTPIAVVGVSALFPGSPDAFGFWRNILAGRDLLTDVPPSHWLVEDYYDPDPQAPDKTYARRGGFLPDVEFRPMDFGIPPSILPATDTSQLLALVVAHQVLEDAARGDFKNLDKEHISVILGVTSAQELMLQMASRLERPVWLKALRESGLEEEKAQEACDRIASHYVPWQESTFPGLLGNVVAGRIANRFDLGGTNCVTDAACASSLSALAMAAGELELGRSKLVIAGGVDTFNDIAMFMCFSKTPALSPSGDCRPFDASSDGTMLGEGLGMVALKRLADAERDGDRVYAVVRGVGSSSDGRALSIYAPLAKGQANALRRAYAEAGYGPASVELVEAHGTGTKAGDVAEFESLRTVFGESGRGDRGWCALGSVKSQVGHTKAAAGAAGLFKVVMALHHKALPPTIKVEQPNPKLGLADSPFYLNTTARPWIRDATHPRRAGLSSFGFGGSNFHVTLEEYVGPAQRPLRFRTLPAELLLLSAATPEALIAGARAIDSKAPLAGLARASQASFDPRQDCRLAVVASEVDVASKLAQAAEAISRTPREPWSSPAGSYETGLETGKLAFLFPGQGSQYPGMGSELALHFDAARQAWDLAASLHFAPDAKLHEVVFPRPAWSDAEREAQKARLTATEWAQPAIGAASLALLELVRAVGVRPDCVGGHSFGELVALHAAGALDAVSLLRAARRRGELMAEAASAGAGAMTAVSGDTDAVERMVAASGLGVSVANQNSPRQLVLSGSVEAIQAVEGLLASEGIACQRLPVATAFHSSLVAAASAPFLQFLEGVPLRAPALTAYAGAMATAYPPSPAEMRRILAEQLARPVRFASIVEAMYAQGVRTFVEVGPGSVLTGLVEQCLAGRPHRCFSLDRKGQSGVPALWAGLGRLAVSGVALDFEPLWAGFALPAPAAKPAGATFSISINGANYGKPYPPPGGAAALPRPNPPERTLRMPPTPDSAAQVNAPTQASVPQAAALPAPSLAAPSDGGRAALEAYAAFQRGLSEGHQKYLAAMETTLSESHKTFVKSMESSFLGLCSALSGQPLPAPVHEAPATRPSAPPATPPPPVWTTPEPPRVEVAAAAMAPPPALPPSLDWSRPEAPPQSPTPDLAAKPASPVLDATALLLAIVSEKTGYPPEMLKLEMSLEADLGIDSIKRVEILAAMQERVPGLPKVAASEMAALQTLSQIVAFMERQHGGAAPTPVVKAAAPATPVAAVPPPAPAATLEPPVVTRSVVRAVRAPAPGASLLERMRAGRVAVTPDGAGIAEALVERLRERSVMAEVTDVPGDAASLVFLSGLRPVGGIDAALAVNREAFGAARAVAPRFTKDGGVFVTVQDTGGDFGLSGSADRAWLAGLSGLAKTAALEWPAAAVRALDVERGERSSEAVAAALLQELEHGGLEREIGLRADGSRVRLEAQAAAAALSDLPLDEKSVVVASGGARGVTAAALQALARAARPRFLLLGRTALADEPEECRGKTDEAGLKQALLLAATRAGRNPTPAELKREAERVESVREVRATLRALEEAGSQALYAAADLRDPAALRAALGEARAAWGPISAIVHGAGVLADKLIAEKSPEQFDRVFDTKVLGLRALLEATEQDPLRAIALFSSVAARFGNPGQCDYAMANEILNKVAHALAVQRPGLRVKSLNWGPWDGGMVTPALRAHFESRGVPLIPLASGAHAFVDELRTAGEVEVVFGGPLVEEAREIREPVSVTRGEYPWLHDHRIQDVPVVPAVLVLDWFVRAAQDAHPGLAVRACKDLRVLKGVSLPGYLDGGDRLTLVRNEKRNGAGDVELAFELRGSGGALHYAGTVDMGPPESGSRAGRAPRDLALARSPWSPSELYRGILFHGPSLHAIRSIEGISERGLVASLSGMLDLGWPAGPWHLDVAALDGGLQLARVWGAHLTGRASLPTRIGGFRMLRTGPVSGPIRCVLQGELIGDHRTVSQLTLDTPEGEPVAVLDDVEMHLLPDYVVPA